MADSEYTYPKDEPQPYREEYAAWAKLVAALKEAAPGISEADWQASPASPDDTAGKKALTAIQVWGEALAALRHYQAMDWQD